MRDSVSPHLYQYVLFSNFEYSHPSGCEYLTLTMIRLAILVAIDVEHSCTCLLGIGITSLDNCLQLLGLCVSLIIQLYNESSSLNSYTTLQVSVLNFLRETIEI